tara:strand:- start:38 stop:253 length:216 start_codon:yes stop_codon:yes gene_type:complete
MIDTDKYEGQLEDDNTDTWVVWRIAKESLEEVKRLRKELKEAEDVIQYALDRVGNDDDAKRVFEDFLEVIE